MKIALHGVSKGRRGSALPETTVEFESGEARFIRAETEQRPTVLGLIASGRMRPDTGHVTIDGARDAKQIRRRIALVDALEVSDPPANVSLAGIVGEELMFAGRGATPLHARRWLDELGFDELAGLSMGDVPATARVRILSELAVLRPDVDGFVLVRPDRHGGSPDGWWRITTEFAERGYAVLVIVGGSAALALERMPEYRGPRIAVSGVPDIVVPAGGTDVLGDDQPTGGLDTGNIDADESAADGSDEEDSSADDPDTDDSDADDASAKESDPDGSDTDDHDADGSALGDHAADDPGPEDNADTRSDDSQDTRSGDPDPGDSAPPERTPDELTTPIPPEEGEAR